MAIQWSEEQLKAIHTTDHNILVSASAGAGKTTVLVARLMKRMLQDHISIDRIVAMTFTEAAASEMKKRLLQSLNDKLQEPNLSEAEAQFCRQQLILLQSAHISTIHSFCLSVIKADYALIGLNPARIRHIFDDAAVAQMKEKAFTQACRNHMRQDPEQFTTLLQYFSSRSEDISELKKAVLAIAAKAGGSQDPQAWIQAAAEAYAPIARLDQLPSPLKKIFFERCAVEASRLEDCAVQMQRLLFDAYPDQAKQANEILLFLGKLTPAIQAAKNADYREYRRALFGAIQTKISTLKDALEFNNLRKQLNALAKDLVSRTYSEEMLLSDLALTYAVLKPLTALTLDYLTFYAQLKEAQEGIDFDDMEHFAYRILTAENGLAAQRYRERFDEIMVDEFQDSNDLQNAIIGLISRGANVFRVGDVKQSIYRFRGGKPQIMRDLMNDPRPENCFIHLSSNYRSKQMIVDFNNDLFLRLMNIPGCSDQYTDHDCVKTGAPAQKQDNYPVEFHALMVKALKEQAEEMENLAANPIKAQYIAQQILTMHETSDFRHWKDYVVLVRSHAVKTHLKQAFEQAGIPYYIDAKAGFFQSEAMQILLSWFRILINPADNLSLTAVLSSDFYQMSDEELAELAMKRGRRLLFDMLKEMHHPLVADRQRLNGLVQKQGLCALLDAMFQIHHFYEEHCTAQQRTNCDLLRQKAEQYSREHSDSLTGFLDMIEQVSEEKTSEAIPVGNEDDVVKVMTIHQSKGLQFPVVFYWASSRIDIMDKKETCIADADLGIGLPALELPWRFKRPTAIRQAIEYKITLEELEENIRILYVALTRAQNQMILVDTVKGGLPQKPMTMNTLLERKGTTDLILSAMSQSQADFWKVRIIEDRWEVQQLQRRRHSVVTLPRYTEEKPLPVTLTPSETEQTAYIPALFPNRTAIRPAQRGIQLHEAVELLPTEEWTEDLIRRLLPEIRLSDIRLLLQLSRQSLFQQCQRMNVEKELSFAVLSGNELIHGQMDYVAQDESHVILIDFKSDRHAQVDQLKTLYARQISIYQRCLHQMYPEKQIQAYLYSFDLDQFIEMTPETELAAA